VTQLIWMDRHNRSQTYKLSGEETVIGRQSDSDIILGGYSISRHHARIIREDKGLCLVDQSTHGTFVNGQRIDRHRLSNGDRIRLGREEIELLYTTQKGDITPISDTWSGPELEKSIKALSQILPSRDSAYSDLDKIACVLDFHYNWGKNFSAEQTFLQILKSALEISGAERGFILLPQDKEFRYEAGLNYQGITLPQSDFRASRTVVRQVVESAKPVFMTQEISGELAQQESVLALRLAAVACLPLSGISASSDAVALLGILYLDSTKRMHMLSGLDKRIMNKLAEQAGLVLEKLEMIKSLEERKKIENELALAEETQKNLLSSSLPKLENFRIHAFNHPTRYVGGDFYEFLVLEKGELVAVLADVSGKGISAALLGSLVQGALNMEFRSTTRPGEVLNKVNKLLFEKTESYRFVTLFLCVFDPSGKGRFISAGHNPAYVFRAESGEIEELADSCLILGAFDFATYASSPFQLHLGDILVIYSDGLTEAENPEGEMFGEKRLREVITLEGRNGSQILERRLLDVMEQFTRGRNQTDDITFVLVEKCV
jgi:sigma-B regulation protein RsbU (phosphoserine phosphatase)